MARKIPANRFRNLISIATEVFIAKGYRGTQMEDVATHLKVAKGTLYGYVQGKEALFDAALRYCDGLETLPERSDLPLPLPKPGATARYLAERTTEESRRFLLAQTVSDTGSSSTVDLSRVCHDLYQHIHRNRRTIKLIDRCAVDRPDLAKIWFGVGRWTQHGLLMRYLEQEITADRLLPLPDIAVAARLILETIVFWALHRHWDPSPQQLNEEQVEQVVIDLLLHGFPPGGMS